NGREARRRARLGLAWVGRGFRSLCTPVLSGGSPRARAVLCGVSGGCRRFPSSRRSASRRAGRTPSLLASFGGGCVARQRACPAQGFSPDRFVVLSRSFHDKAYAETVRVAMKFYPGLDFMKHARYIHESWIRRSPKWRSSL